MACSRINSVEFTSVELSVSSVRMTTSDEIVEPLIRVFTICLAFICATLSRDSIVEYFEFSRFTTATIYLLFGEAIIRAPSKDYFWSSLCKKDESVSHKKRKVERLPV